MDRYSRYFAESIQLFEAKEHGRSDMLPELSYTQAWAEV
jgi:hypothetical protein